MEKYRGIVREIYEYEVEIEAEDSADAIIELKRIYEDDSVEGIFVAEASSYLRAEFSLRK